MLSAVFLDYGSVGAPDELDLSSLKTVLPLLHCYSHTQPSDLQARVADVEVLMVNSHPVSAATMEQAPKLRCIATTSTGTNHIDIAHARSRGIAVINIVDYCTPSVAQHVFATLLALTHHLIDYDRDLKKGVWQHDPFNVPDYPVRELSGLNFGIVGYGHLGQAVANLARAFGMNVLVANRPGGAREAGRMDLEQMLPLVDVLSLHCPLNEATRHLIGTAQLALMKPTAILINTARGGLVDAQALAKALRAHRLGGAGIDVLAEEPPLKGNPLLAADLTRVIITPHTAWSALQSRQRGLDQLAAHLGVWAAGGRSGRVD